MKNRISSISHEIFCLFDGAKVRTFRVTCTLLHLLFSKFVYFLDINQIGTFASLAKTSFLVVSVLGIIHRVVQASALFALDGLSCDEIAHIDHIAQFADILGGLDALEEFLCLLIDDVQTCPGAMQAQVGAHDAYIV